MRKLSKEKSQPIAEYAYYIQRAAEYETALYEAIRAKNDYAREHAINGAKWAAKNAITAANVIGLDSFYIPQMILNRAK